VGLDFLVCDTKTKANETIANEVADVIVAPLKAII